MIMVNGTSLCDHNGLRADCDKNNRLDTVTERMIMSYILFEPRIMGYGLFAAKIDC